jgi:phage terminase Nu1 subunit (DNA packaging protein)
LRSDSELEEPLLTRKAVAGIFGISLVTLHDWINRGLPCIKQGGRAYFLRSEVMDYVKGNRRNRSTDNARKLSCNFESPLNLR